MSFEPFSLSNMYLEEEERPLKVNVLYSAHRGTWSFRNLENAFSEVFRRGLRMKFSNCLKWLFQRRGLKI